MREVSRQHGWADIVKALGKFTVKECETRYAVVRNRQRSIQKRGAAAILNNTGRTSAFRHVPERNPDDPPKLWGLAEDLKLIELLKERGEFDFVEFQKYIPEFSQSSMYNALDRILCYPAHATGNWTPSEDAALLKLVHTYGVDWKRISEEMPTGRSSVQCRSHYTTQIARPVLTQRRWSDEEVRQLELLVNLNTRTVYVDNSTHQPMLDKETNVLLKLVSDSTTISSKLSGLLQALGQDMGNSSEIDALILKQTEGNEQAAKRAIRKIDWPLIASYLMPRTPLQCSIKWARVRYAKLEAQDMYWGPWTREEDVQLYKLYCRAPGKWVWISENLARPRSHFLAKKRYVYYVGRYINMLKACKGPDWDPVADQLEEVHMRCEISAWYTQRLEGYRPQDPYPCPYNVDLTGYSQHIKKQYTFR
ncbi:hypothetical protein GGF37_001759 [Kickxella alabastrina]|nr:hypothetical protein GGF37_001759 [Kickxella alabastrina]